MHLNKFFEYSGKRDRGEKGEDGMNHFPVLDPLRALSIKITAVAKLQF